MIVSAVTHRGIVREENQDALAINDKIMSGDCDSAYFPDLESSDSNLLMIADGMGGHARGKLASHKALGKLVGLRRELFDPSRCIAALEQANDYLFDIMAELPETAGMGSTIVGAAICNLNLCYFNVGDSRLYVYDGKYLKQLSHDDSLNSDSKRDRKMSHMITQALGGQYRRRKILPHTGLSELSHGDLLLVCSDGLTDLLGDEEISKALAFSSGVRESTSSLLDAAIERGGRDNISIIIAEV